MSKGVITTEQLDAERSLVVIRAELEKLHRLSPKNLPKSRFASIVSLLPTAQDIRTPAPASTATATAFATLDFIRRALVSTIFRLWWFIIYGLAMIGGTTVGFGLLVYLLTKLPWQTSFTADGQGWQRYSDGYYYSSYTTAVEVTVKTNIPELEGRDL